MAEPLPFSGEQFTIRTSRAVARIGAVAAVLRELRVDDVRLTETVPDDALPPMGCGIVLAPWPNRVRDGRWTLDGEVQQLDLTEPKSGSASHGLLRNTAYRLRARSEDSVTLGALIAPQHGWPFLLDSWVRYTVRDDGLEVTHGARNLGDRRSPWAVGAHPYFRIGETPVEELALAIDRSLRTELDERLLPVAIVPVEGDFDLREPRRLGGLDLITAYGDPEPRTSRVDAARLTAPDGARLVLWLDPDFGWVQAYTPHDFPRAGAPAQAVALEPQTAAPDALNSGIGLLWLEPGESWEGSWGVRYEPGGAAVAEVA